VVPETGVEPARLFRHWILSPARLPIPPPGQRAAGYGGGADASNPKTTIPRGDVWSIEKGAGDGGRRRPGASRRDARERARCARARASSSGSIARPPRASRSRSRTTPRPVGRSIAWARPSSSAPGSASSPARAAPRAAASSSGSSKRSARAGSAPSAARAGAPPWCPSAASSCRRWSSSRPGRRVRSRAIGSSSCRSARPRPAREKASRPTVRPRGGPRRSCPFA
jgi:hypothetical protein